MLNRIAHFIQGVLPKDSHVLVALSGGADSVCLLLCLKQLGYKLTAAHCNFHLRAAESDRDEDFVRQLCQRQGVPLEVKHFNTLSYAQSQHVSVEMAARDLRYEWFAQLSSTVAVAHHQDDNAETMLLNLTRSSGLQGLCGMRLSRTVNGLNVVRPLLCVTRQEIITYLNSLEQDYVTDSTNDEDDARRNILRHHVLPVLQQLNPRIAPTLQQTAQRLQEAASLCEWAEKRLLKDIVQGERISKAALLHSPAPLTLLHKVLSPCGFNEARCRQILSESSGTAGAIYSSATHRLLRDRDCWFLRQGLHRPTLLSTTLSIEGETQLSDIASIKAETQTRAAGFVIDKSKHAACLDLDTIQLPLQVRYAQPGDWFRPYGMGGKRTLVSDYLTDRHIDLFHKEQQLVLLSRGEICWLVGHRISHSFAVTSSTVTLLHLTLSLRPR